MYTELIPHTPESTRPFFQIVKGFDRPCDFALWILQTDGLHVPPFDRHPEGNGKLQRLGMTAQQWVFRMQCLDDMRLRWHIPNFEARLAKEHQRLEPRIQAAIAQGIPVTATDEEILKATVERRLHHTQRGYHEAVEHLPIDVDRSATPPYVWHGNSAVQEQLQDLWNYHLEHEAAHGEATSSTFTHQGDEHALYAAIHQSGISQHQSMLYLRFVHYPQRVALTCPPASIVLSWCAACTSSWLRQLVK
jgi:hypothetical protein